MTPKASDPAAALTRQLDRLNAERPGKHRVVSCYLKIEPRDRSRGKYLIKLKNRIRAIEQALPQLGLPRGIVEAVEQDMARLYDHLKAPGNLPASHGLAVFVCGPRKLFEVVSLPRVHRSRLAVDHTPLVRELASVEDEFGRLLAVVFDRTAARFFEVTAFAARELDGIASQSTRGGKFRGDQGRPGWGEHTYNNRIRQEKQRHFERVAQQLFTLDRRRPVHGIAIGATGPDVRSLQPFLHPYLRERVMGDMRLNPKETTLAEVQTATLESRQAWERESERERLAELREGLGTGWAVNGIAPTLRALARGQVRTLLVDPDASAPGWRGPTSGQVGLNPRDVAEEGDPIPVVDVVDDAIEEALRQRVAVDVVYDTDAAQALDGIGALLRFR